MLTNKYTLLTCAGFLSEKLENCVHVRDNFWNSSSYLTSLSARVAPQPFSWKENWKQTKWLSTLTGSICSPAGLWLSPAPFLLKRFSHIGSATAALPPYQLWPCRGQTALILYRHMAGIRGNVGQALWSLHNQNWLLSGCSSILASEAFFFF